MLSCCVCACGATPFSAHQSMRNTTHCRGDASRLKLPLQQNRHHSHRVRTVRKSSLQLVCRKRFRQSLQHSHRVHRVRAPAGSIRAIVSFSEPLRPRPAATRHAPLAAMALWKRNARDFPHCVYRVVGLGHFRARRWFEQMPQRCECAYASSTDIKRSISSPTICTIHMSGHSQHGSHWNHISSTWRACTASKSCKRIRKLVAHLQTASLSSKTGPAHPK